MYIRRVRVKGKIYYQEVEAYWKDGKKKIRVIRHLGTNPPAKGSLGTNTRREPGPSSSSAASTSGECEARDSGGHSLPPGGPGPSPEAGAVQAAFNIPLGDVSPTPPYIIKEYIVTSSLAELLGQPGGAAGCWRIKGSNGAWWPTSENPRNFLSLEEAQGQLRKLWSKGK